MPQTPIVAIVGRPNVGKSTLFNRLVEARDAIVDNVSGVTRDRHYGQAEWLGKKFTVIDTGGYVVGSEDVFEDAIRRQVQIAVDESSALLMVVDARTGLTDMDKEFANVLRRSKKPILLVANKVDEGEQLHGLGEFYALGLGDPFPIAAVSGSGTGDLLDELTAHFPKQEEDVFADAKPRIAIVGRPNVGKSSLINLMLGQQRTIVTDIAGTTRDAIDSEYNAYGKEFIITDTAGIRRKSRIKEDIEFYSVLRSIRAVEMSDVCIVVLDATQGMEAQDASIVHLAMKNHKGVVIMVNKWDLVEKDTNTARQYEEDIRAKLMPHDFIPIVFTSVHEKQRIMKVIETALRVCDNRRKKVPTSQLNEVLLPEIERIPPPAHRGRYIRIKYITQLPVYTPTFAFYCNFPKYVRQQYERFLEGKIRENFDFEGVPIRILFKEK